MKPRRIVAALLALALSPDLNAVVIDFEGFAAGTIIDDEYFASLGVTIRGVNTDEEPNPKAGNLGITFDTDCGGEGEPACSGGDGDLAAPFTSPNNPALGNLSPGNILIIHEHPDECTETMCMDPDDEGSRPAGYFDITFDEVVTLLSIDFFDIETAENGTTPGGDNAIQLFGSGGVEIMPDTFYTPDTGNNSWVRLRSTFPG